MIRLNNLPRHFIRAISNELEKLKPQTDWLYGSGYFFEVPMEDATSIVDPPPIISEFLQNNNFTIVNYRDGLAKDQYGRIRRIGKVLPKEIKKFFDNDSRRSSSGRYILRFTRHPHDILMASTNQSWTSCHNLEKITREGHTIFGSLSSFENENEYQKFWGLLAAGLANAYRGEILVYQLRASDRTPVARHRTSFKNPSGKPYGNPTINFVSEIKRILQEREGVKNG
jgi:hypothetical protein